MFCWVEVVSDGVGGSLAAIPLLMRISTFSVNYTICLISQASTADV
jgi:hypothetical protein